MSTESHTTPAHGAATVAMRHRSDELLSKLAERVGARVRAENIYGAPIERDGVTVVPVAAARFGIGAGGGSDPAKGQEGEGGGGAGSVTPVGYIELKGGRSRFVPFVNPAKMVALVACAVLVGLTIARPAARERRRPGLPWR
jgi:uncharacterized spore protein YtfJ